MTAPRCALRRRPAERGWMSMLRDCGRSHWTG
jgi:hypothetical protein